MLDPAPTPLQNRIFKTEIASTTGSDTHARRWSASSRRLQCKLPSIKPSGLSGYTTYRNTALKEAASRTINIECEEKQRGHRVLEARADGAKKIAEDLTILQECLETLKRDKDLSEGIAPIPALRTSNTQNQHGGRITSKQHKAVRQKFETRPAGRAVAHEVKLFILEVKKNPAKLHELSQRCLQYIAERNMNKRENSLLQTDFITTNRDVFHLANQTTADKLLYIKQQSALQQVKAEQVRHQRVDRFMSSQATKSNRLAKKLNHIALLTGTMSPRQAIEATTAHLWFPVLSQWFCVNACLRVVLECRNNNEKSLMQQKIRAVNTLENWWGKFMLKRNKGLLRVRGFISKRVAPWKTKAKNKALARNYLLIAQFIKDWAQSKKVVTATSMFLKQTRHLQKWWKKVILTRRSRKRMWLMQWLRFEEAQRHNHDVAASKAIKRHKVGEALVPHPPVNHKRPGKPKLLPRRANLDITLYKEIVGGPAIRSEVKEAAIHREVIIMGKKHLRKIAAHEAELENHHEHVRQLKRRHAATKKVTPDIEDLVLPPAPVRPIHPCLLPFTDLARIVEVTTRKATTEIQNKVKKSMVC
eukprot:TRINITY_DN33929_c0_g1_i1.p1 TRINITY_DN33929_c0_g1~~TRINITY_DN33929_c0_g1_i1.p1  ORF type:complete len:588 (+),score=95.99 TRINITY_DN33929_c0_g1_i1:48-1811(+)